MTSTTTVRGHIMNAKEITSDQGESPLAAKREIGSASFTLMQSIGERIKWARERKDMTQKELGRLAGKSRASIVQYENGNITAPIDVIIALAKALFVAPEYLAFGRSGVPGVKNAEEEIQTLTELSESGSTMIPTGGWAVPRDMFGDFGGKLRVVKLKVNEPDLDLKHYDRLVLDMSDKFRRDGCYMVGGPYGHRVVRLSSGMTMGNTLRMTSGYDGSYVTVPVDDIIIIGLVVGIFRRTY